MPLRCNRQHSGWIRVKIRAVTSGPFSETNRTGIKIFHKSEREAEKIVPIAEHLHTRDFITKIALLGDITDDQRGTICWIHPQAQRGLQRHVCKYSGEFLISSIPTSNENIRMVHFDHFGSSSESRCGCAPTQKQQSPYYFPKFPKNKHETSVGGIEMKLKIKKSLRHTRFHGYILREKHLSKYSISKLRMNRRPSLPRIVSQLRNWLSSDKQSSHQNKSRCQENETALAFK
ncbi:hypothetical protein WN51_10369 [Melipona quadrifasciata]|uniref:Uncharacterized protein n=1 Tax=Melipona quadrifasciata TaxID=166423 RepID=A0A0N0BJ30_9HYME|nr:hypothetical protein WN51_10369 [Melipona quadrifasciata]